VSSRKPLTQEQAEALFQAAVTWQEQGTRTKFSSPKTHALWDLVEHLKKDRRRELFRGDRVPEVGQDIYVGSSFYIDRGEDDVVGGLAEVVKVKPCVGGRIAIYVAEHPGHGYYWDVLQPKQAEYEKQFGEARAYPDPDV